MYIYDNTVTKYTKKKHEEMYRPLGDIWIGTMNGKII